MNAAGAEISAIANARGATIRGAKGGSGFSGGDGGSGVASAGEITALINSGAIRGGGGGNGEIGSTFGGPGGAGGAGVSSAARSPTLTNAGTIRGGQGGSGITGGAGGAGVDLEIAGRRSSTRGKTLGGKAVDGGTGGDGVIGAGLAIVDSGTIDAGDWRPPRLGASRCGRLRRRRQQPDPGSRRDDQRRRRRLRSRRHACLGRRAGQQFRGFRDRLSVPGLWPFRKDRREPLDALWNHVGPHALGYRRRNAGDQRERQSRAASGGVSFDGGALEFRPA